MTTEDYLEALALQHPTPKLQPDGEADARIWIGRPPCFPSPRRTWTKSPKPLTASIRITWSRLRLAGVRLRLELEDDGVVFIDRIEGQD
jgi:hypothetical protein